MTNRKECVVCGGWKNKDGSEPIVHCGKCGRPVCSFCAHLGVCCDMDDDECDDAESSARSMQRITEEVAQLAWPTLI